MPLRLHTIAGSLVVAVGFWVLSGELPAVAFVLVAMALVGLLLWLAHDAATIWAWVTLLLGLESLAWPVSTMIRARLTGAPPTEEEMAGLLTAVVFGLFSSVFWLTFSYGLFRRARQPSNTAD